jgi:hypothetical protein
MTDVVAVLIGYVSAGYWAKLPCRADPEEIIGGSHAA